MTNLEKLTQEIASMDAKKFNRMFLSQMSKLSEALDRIKCNDCAESHGGKCPLDADDAYCDLSMDEWLSQTCTRDKLIGVTR